MTQSYSEEVRETAAIDGQVIMPFYLIIDISGSMTGDEQNLTAAIDDLIQAIRKDPVVDDLVMLSIITFNHIAQTVVPLGSPSGVTAPPIRAGGGTSYGEAFREYHQAFEQDRARLKGQGMKVYRPCVFFLTDGAPGDSDWYQTFKSLFSYDPTAKSGNRAFPYFVPYGFRDAPEHVMRQLAYPNFGPTKGRWFLSKTNNAGEVLKAMAEVLGNTAISSGLSAERGVPQIVPPTPVAGSNAQFGEAEDWM